MVIGFVDYYGRIEMSLVFLQRAEGVPIGRLSQAPAAVANRWAADWRPPFLAKTVAFEALDLLNVADNFLSA